MEAELGSFGLVEHIIKNNRYKAMICKTSNKHTDQSPNASGESGTDSVLISFKFDFNPLDSPAYMRISMESQAVEVVILLEVLGRIVKFFTPEESYDLHALEAAAFERLEGITNAT
eukprot:763542_1